MQLTQLTTTVGSLKANAMHQSIEWGAGANYKVVYAVAEFMLSGYAPCAMVGLTQQCVVGLCGRGQKAHLIQVNNISVYHSCLFLTVLLKVGKQLVGNVDED